MVIVLALLVLGCVCGMLLYLIVAASICLRTKDERDIDDAEQEKYLHNLMRIHS